jgi:hypothetical protein
MAAERSTVELERKMTGDTCGSRILPRTRKPGTGLFAIVAGIAFLSGACSSGSSTPHVASLGDSGSPASNGSGTSAAPGSTGNATQLVDKWAACMRRHGDTGQADPTIDNNGVIQITVPPQGPGGENYSLEAHNSTGPCGSYLQAASKALLGGRPSPPPTSLVLLLKYARCMRAHGVPKYPDPNGSGETYIGNLDPNGPLFQNANKLCSKETGTPSGSQPEPPGSIMVGPGAGPSGGVRPSAVPSGAVHAASSGSGANG